MDLYRIDNRERTIGQIFEPQNLYMSSLDGRRLEVEELLELYRPEIKPSRHSVLMLYEDFDAAKNHWLKQINSKFYQVDSQGIEILHQADSLLIEFLCENWDAREDFNEVEIAKGYWNGSFSERPIIEIFVRSATISKIISSSEQQRMNEYKYKHQIAFPDIKPDPHIERIVKK